MSNPMLSSWYPADPFLFLEKEIQSAPSRRAASVFNKIGVGYQDPAVLPANPDPFPRDGFFTCGDLLYRPPTRTPRPECKFFFNPKPWNPNDPCLIEAAKEYWRHYDEIDRTYSDLAANESRTLNTNMERIERERVECRARCDFSFGICERACDDYAAAEKKNYQDSYNRYMEDLSMYEKGAKNRVASGFWAAAQACGYTPDSFGGYAGQPQWGGRVPILREETQA